VHYGAPRRVSSISHATALLGTESLRALAVSAACAMLDEVSQDGPAGFWRHGLLTAAAASVIARHVGGSPADAFSAGLLHDLGAVLLHSSDRVAFNAAQRAGSRTSDVLAAEIDAFGASHTMVGAEALDAWCFPAHFVEAVAMHHGADDPQHLLGRIVRAAEAVASSLQPELGHVLDVPVERALSLVRLTPSHLPSIVDQMKQRLSSTADLLAGS
jgi:putative nucleotidyltransferase with HDIG domain